MAIIHCKHSSGRYVELDLKFKDGKANVSEEKLAEVKKSEYWKKGEIFLPKKEEPKK